jgi:hypothetical protein
VPPVVAGHGTVAHRACLIKREDDVGHGNLQFQGRGRRACRGSVVIGRLVANAQAPTRQPAGVGTSLAGVVRPGAHPRRVRAMRAIRIPSERSRRSRGRPPPAPASAIGRTTLKSPHRPHVKH